MTTDDLTPGFPRRGEKFRLGPWTVDPLANEIRDGEHVERLEPKAMEVLVCLATHAGEAVPREALREAVWPDVVVTEGTLTRCVSQLRKSLGDEARDPEVIETIPKVGYRLIATVRPVERNAEAAAPPAMHGPSAPRRRRLWALVLGAGAVAAFAAALVWAMRPAALPALHPPEPLTSMPGIESAAALSPDGDRLAFVHLDSVGPRLYLQTTAMDAPVRLTRGGPGEGTPTWSPDGREVAFFRWQDGFLDLYRVEVGSQTERLVEEGFAAINGLSWAPDGRTLVYASYDTTGTFRIHALDLATLEQRVLTDPPPSYFGDQAPVFSPDGAWILFLRAPAMGVMDLYRVPSGGGPVERLTHDAAATRGHAWTPDGEGVVFVSLRGGLPQIWHLTVPDGTLRLLPGVSARDPRGPLLTPDGAHLIFESRTSDVNLWAAPAREAAASPGPTRLVASTWEDKHPSLSADGARLAFISTRSGTPELWRSRADGDAPVQLTTFGGGDVAAPRWSPSGRRIAFEARLEGQTDLFVVDAEGGPPRRLTEAPSNERVPRWSRDGRSLYFASDRSGRWEIWMMSAAGGEARRVTRDGGFAAEESPRGDTLYYSFFDRPGIWAAPLGEGEPVEVYPALRRVDWGAWTVHETGLYAVDRQPGMHGFGRLGRLDRATGTLVPLAPRFRALDLTGPSLALSPDGQVVIYANTDRVESDLVQVRLPTPL